MSVMPQPAPTPVDPAFVAWLQGLFAFHQLTVRQKLLTLAEKYRVEDPDGQPRFWVVRPPRIALNMLAGVAALSVNVLFLVIAYRTYMNHGEILLPLALLFVGGNLGLLVRRLLAPYRDIRICADEAEQWPVLHITQDNKIGFYHRFTVVDACGAPVAFVRRHAWRALLRTRWSAETLSGEPICEVIEDSLTLSALRRYLGPLYGMLRTNFDFLLPGGQRIGEYNRKLTLTDQYLLNVADDPAYLVDRRMVLALAILLDTGERR